MDFRKTFSIKLKNKIYEIISGKGKVKEYNYYNGILRFEGEY